VPVIQQIASFLLSLVDCEDFPNEQYEAVAVFLWQIIAKLAQTGALSTSTELLFSIYSHFAFPRTDELCETVCRHFETVAIAHLMNTVPETQCLERGLVMFHFLFKNSYCSPLLADGYALKQVCDCAFTSEQCFAVRHFAQRVFCDAVTLCLPALLPVMHEDELLRLTCQAFIEMTESWDDREFLVAVGEALGKLSEHVLLPGHDQLLRVTLSGFEVREALAELEDVGEPIIDELVRCLTDLYTRPEVEEMGD
jgi:hypothetical protein